jgi:phage protein D
MITPGIEQQDPSLGNIKELLGEPSKAPSDFAFIQIGFLDDSTIQNVPPENLISFTYNNTITTEADVFTLDVFDATWSKFEELLIKQKDNLKFRFGWAKGHQSQWRKATIEKHTPSFEVNGVRISIEGFDQSIIANEEAKSRDWSDKTYIHEIVEAIAESHGWLYDEASIARTKIVPDEDDNPRKFIQYRMPDMTFINEVLIKHARLEDNERSGFSCWLDSTSNKLFFRPPGLDAPTTKTYIVYKYYLGEVIRFSPELGDGAIQRGMGALNLRVTGLNPFTRELYDVIVDNKESTSAKIVNGDFIPDQVIETVGGTGRPLYTPALTADAAQLEALQRWFLRFNMFFTAELEVVGDPHITPGTNIGVLVLDAENKPHYCSGRFYVAGVTHTINNGTFTSSMLLWKNAQKEGTLDVKQKGYGQVFSDWDTISQSLPYWVPPIGQGTSLPDLYQWFESTPTGQGQGGI